MRLNRVKFSITMPIPPRLLMPFAHSIYAKSAALRDTTFDLTTKQRARLRESICDDIKKCSDSIIPEASDAALNKAKDIGIDLFTKDWHDQSTFDPGRKIFHWEHVQPVSAICDLCITCSSVNDVQGILQEQLRVAWILKAEDAELSMLGYRSKRGNPDAAYSEARIRLRKQGE